MFCLNTFLLKYILCSTGKMYFCVGYSLKKQGLPDLLFPPHETLLFVLPPIITMRFVLCYYFW